MRARGRQPRLACAAALDRASRDAPSSPLPPLRPTARPRSGRRGRRALPPRAASAAAPALAATRAAAQRRRIAGRRRQRALLAPSRLGWHTTTTANFGKKFHKHKSPKSSTVSRPSMILPAVTARRSQSASCHRVTLTSTSILACLCSSCLPTKHEPGNGAMLSPSFRARKDSGHGASTLASVYRGTCT